MADEIGVTTAEEEAEFDAAFAESAKASELAETDDPGEVGATEDVSEEDKDFAEAFDVAAGLPAATEAKEEDPDVDNNAELERLKAENEELRQKDRSQRNRVSALTKKLIGLRAADDQQPPEGEEVDGKATPDAKEEDKDDDFEEFRDEFPEMALVIDKRVNETLKKIDEVSRKVGKVAETTNTLADDKITEDRQEQIDTLLNSHSDVVEVLKSPEYAKWKESAPAEIVALTKSHDAEDGIRVLDNFKEQTGWKKAASPDASGKSEVELINERRNKTLEASVGISSKKVGHPARQATESGDDFDDAFAEAASKKEKQLALTR